MTWYVIKQNNHPTTQINVNPICRNNPKFYLNVWLFFSNVEMPFSKIEMPFLKIEIPFTKKEGV